MLTLSRNLGLMTGALAMGAAFAALAGPSPTPADITGATRWTFALASAVVALALAARVGASAVRGAERPVI
ncbi:hypothetical protein ACFQV2_25915 [Actinokineospora soli]|uniref:Major facilitator superfamily (MFS) profile domain-containing protein n=1 Tax=Actinokineospora soli TaxID=1048753 RepID=A0ABW2TRD7_9PSEU